MHALMSDDRLYAFFCNVVHLMKDIVYRGRCKKGFLYRSVTTVSY